MTHTPIYRRYVGFFFGWAGGFSTPSAYPGTNVKSVCAPTDKRAQEWGESTAAEYGWRLMEVRRFDSLPAQQQDYYHRLYGWKDTP